MQNAIHFGDSFKLIAYQNNIKQQKNPKFLSFSTSKVASFQAIAMITKMTVNPSNVQIVHWLIK